MTDGEALLRAITADPRDDLLRLVYADWLEEAGERDRAALIRIQIERTRDSSVELEAIERALLEVSAERVWQRRRVWALPATLQQQWPRDVGGWEWHRGFAEVWHCPLSLWEAHGAALVAAGPVVRVVLIDRVPQSYPPNARAPKRAWFRDDANWVQRPDEMSLLPSYLFDLLEPDAFDLAMFEHARSYPTWMDALAALSDACLRLTTGAQVPASGLLEATSARRQRRRRRKIKP